MAAAPEPQSGGAVELDDVFLAPARELGALLAEMHGANPAEEQEIAHAAAYQHLFLQLQTYQRQSMVQLLEDENIVGLRKVIESSTFKNLIKKLKLELALDVAQKLRYVTNVLKAYLVLNLNLVVIRSSSASDRDKIKAQADTMDAFCKFEASFGHCKNLDTWEKLRAEQEAVLTEAERKALRDFYDNFAFMAANLTLHNTKATAALEKVSEILRDPAGSLRDALASLTDAANAVTGMGIAIGNFVKEFKGGMPAA